MPLSDQQLIKWARAACLHYEQRPVPQVPGLRDRDVHLAADVGSLMPVLFFVCRYFHGQAPSPTFVEIGTADGSSAIPLLKAAAELSGHVHSVDPSPCPDAHLLVDQFGYRDSWTHHEMPSDAFFATFNGQIDFAFIDGDHRWPVIERDIRNSYERLRPGGLLWLSDYGPFMGPVPEYADEHDGSGYKKEVGGDAYDERQMSNGVAKAAYRVLPTLARCASLHLPIWPNPSLLIRKLAEHETDPLRPGAP